MNCRTALPRKLLFFLCASRAAIDTRVLCQVELMSVSMAGYFLKKKKVLLNKNGAASGKGSFSHSLCMTLLWSNEVI